MSDEIVEVTIKIRAGAYPADRASREIEISEVEAAIERQADTALVGSIFGVGRSRWTITAVELRP
jgi:hypothetical protein